MDENSQTPETSESPEPLESQAAGIPEVEVPMETETTSVPKQQAAPVKKRKLNDFWLGFLGCLVGNLLLGCIFSSIGIVIASIYPPYNSIGYAALSENTYILIACFLNAIPFLINIGVLIYFLVKHRQGIVMGMLAFYGASLLLTLIGGLLFVAVCFTIGGGN